MSQYSSNKILNWVLFNSIVFITLCLEASDPNDILKFAAKTSYFLIRKIFGLEIGIGTYNNGGGGGDKTCLR
jgi:hypothetical protein